MVRGRIELPTFRVSGLVKAQLGDERQAWRDAYGCQWQVLAAAVAVIVAVSTSVCLHPAVSGSQAEVHRVGSKARILADFAPAAADLEVIQIR